MNEKKTHHSREISIEDARDFILSRIKILPSVRERIGRAAGMTLASDVMADHDVPAFDNSAVDGYAVRERDLSGGRGEFRLIEKARAGTVPRKRLGPGEAALIMTGAPIPGGADFVVPVEFASRSRQRVRVKGYRGKPNVRSAGEVMKKGAISLAAGTRIGPAEAAVLASSGVSDVPVRRRPVVSVISTGDELLRPGSRPKPGFVWSCNSLSVKALAERYGCICKDAGIVRDRPGDVLRALGKALESSDAVISTGGVSEGEWDFVKSAIRNLCGISRTWRVRMQPGRPLSFGVSAGRPVFGLPGNPVAAMISFYQFARPALIAMQGGSGIRIPEVDAVLEEGVSRKRGVVHFLRAKLSYKRGVFRASLAGPQGSAIIGSMAAADALLVVGPDKTEYKAGEKARAQLLDWSFRCFSDGSP